MKPWIRIGRSVTVSGVDLYNNGRVRLNIGGVKLKGLAAAAYLANRRTEHPEEFDERRDVSYSDRHLRHAQSLSGGYTTPKRKKKKKKKH